MNDTVTRLVPTKPDAELAAEFKVRLVAAYEPVLQLMDEIDAAGFQAQIGSTKGPMGQVITQLAITKVY